MTTTNFQPYLEANEFIDVDSVAVQEYVANIVDPTDSLKEQCISLFYGVRDDFPYTPYYVSLNKKELRASHLLIRKKGHCVAKASLLAACARVIGVPSRLGFGTVRNHIGTGRVEEILKTNVLAFHGYTELFVNGKWVKATPAFNKGLCEKLNVAPLDWDGETDALFQEFDRTGNKYMEYLEDYGQFADLPYQLMLDTFRRHYPHLSDNIKEGEVFLDLRTVET